MNGLPYACTAYSVIGVVLIGYVSSMAWRLRRATRLAQERRQQQQEDAS